MKKLILGIVALGATALVGCGGDSTPTPDSGTPDSGTPDSGTPDAGAFVQPAGTVAVNFSVDDSKNKIYVAGDLEWKGAMKYDPTTRTIGKDSSWGGPFAKLYDDGPWNQGGHEPAGSTAGDHKWGVAVFATPPATGKDTYSYGLNDVTACAASSTCVNANGWSWLGDNGSFDVAAGATAAVNATGRSFPQFGTYDIKVTAKKSALDSYCALSAAATCTADADCANANYKCVAVGTAKKCALKQRAKCTGGVACPSGTGTDAQSCQAPDTSKVTFKSSIITWNEVAVADDGAGNFVFQLSATAGAGKAVPHAGLANLGDTPEFLFVLNGNEYRDYSAVGSPANTAGVTAQVKAAAAAAFSPTPIVTLTNGNTSVTVSDAFAAPAGTVAVNFSVDDSKNKIYKAGDLEWKGAMKYDPATRAISKDASWGGPFAKLYDDGPWDQGGHEPAGATAGDSKWGVAVFATPPATGTDTYSYGLNDTTACAPSSTCVNGNGWSWLGTNGSFDVKAGATAAVNATGRSFPQFGTTDVIVTATKSGLDSYCDLSAGATCTADTDCGNANYKCVTVGTAKKCALKTRQKCTTTACPSATLADAQACIAPDTSKVTFKSSQLAWSEVSVADDGTGKFVFTLSKTVGTGNAIPHAGLPNTGDAPEFLWVLNGQEYRDYAATGTPANTAGVTASTKAAGGSAVSATVNTLTNGNTSITIP